MSNKDWPTYLQEQIDTLGLEDQMIDTRAHDGFGDETSLADMVLDDMVSYGT